MATFFAVLVALLLFPSLLPVAELHVLGALWGDAWQLATFVAALCVALYR